MFIVFFIMCDFVLFIDGRALYRQNKRTKTKQKRSITVVLCCSRTRVCAINSLSFNSLVFYCQYHPITDFSFSLSNNFSSTCSVCVCDAFSYISLYGCGVCVYACKSIHLNLSFCSDFFLFLSIFAL
jgi:hypothetical protein